MNRVAMSGFVAAVLLVAVAWAATAHQPAKAGDSPAAQAAPWGGWLSDDPAFVGNSSKIDYPPGYSALANFTLGLINQDRASANLPPVGISAISSGQQHADSMAYYGYFSHWDNQGYKPYMRYSLLGGKGSVTENVALNYCSASATQHTPAQCSLQSVENAINGSEWSMVNNDTVCCDDGHKTNILDPVHTDVSIGIAYNSTTVYLVEDFEDVYISSESLQVSAGSVTFQGTFIQELKDWMLRSSGAEITVFYDPPPQAIAVSQLRGAPSCEKYSEDNEPATCQYQGGYTAGTAVSTIFPSCALGQLCTDLSNFTYAPTWQVNGSSFEIVFPLSGIEAAHGPGVYTFYLWPTERLPEALTSLSVFVTS